MGWWRDHAEDTTRFLKYTYLFCALLFTIVSVFNAFSNYLSRRSFEADLDTSKISGFELLDLTSRRERALATVTLETRCIERTQLALLRIQDATLRRAINEAYLRSMDLRNDIAVQIDQMAKDRPTWAAVVDLPYLRDRITKTSATFSAMEKMLRPAGQVKADDPRYLDAADAITKALIEKSAPLLTELATYGDQRDKAEKELGQSNIYFRTIELLEQRLSRLKSDRDLLRQTLGIKPSELDNVLSRYAAWKYAQLRGTAEEPLLDEFAFDPATQQKLSLASVKCDRFFELLRVTSEPSGWNLLNELSLASFKMPLIAQTLFVTLFLGALGALTINVLRLSKIGWWKDLDEPLWGELLLSPFIGALAAFCIFLLGSTGLLLTSDIKAGQTGVTTLSAFFIGLLGFISGFLYDEAFGRVRRFGAQLFGDPAQAVATSPEDVSLAEALRVAKASYVADLVLKFGIGKRLAAEPEFTLLVPSDEAMSRLTLSAWKEISEPITRPKFEDWFRRHHAIKSVSKSDVSAGKTAEIEAEAAKYPAAVDVDGMTIKSVKVVRPDLNWRNGVIHILHEDLA